MSVQKYNKDLCTGCGACVEYCPRDVWRMDSQTNKAVPVYIDDCQTCYTCELNCPAKAIWVHPHRKAPQMWPNDFEYHEL